MILLAFLLVFPVSCERTDPEAQVEEVRATLLSNYYSSKYFRKVNVTGDKAEIVFSSGDPVSVDTRRVEVLDCRIAPLPEAGQPSEGSVPDGEASLSWVAYDYHFLYLGLSNGHILFIPDSPERSLHSLSFLKEDNPSLSEDLVLQPSGDMVTGKLPAGSEGFLLKPRILYRGKSLLLDGSPLGGDALDFGKKTSLRIDLAGGGSVSYTVALTEDFPTVRIYTNGGAAITSKTEYVPGRIVIDDPERRYSDMEHFEGTMNIRGRGNSTWGMPKKPYRIKLDKKASIFGIPEDKDWVLLANYADKTLLRNTVAMRISAICGMSWTPVIHQVEVYLNDRYQGCYSFTEHKKVSSNRVQVTPEGNYLEIEAGIDQPVWFRTGMNIPIQFQEPENPSEERTAYVKGFLESFEECLLSDNPGDPAEGYPSKIDIPSFVNQYIIQELTKNIDADLFKSQFLTLEQGGLLVFPHVWDFDLALGNCDYFSGHPGMDNSYKGWYIRNYSQEGPGTGWYWYLFKDPSFVAAVKSRWKEVYPSLEALGEEIPSLASRLSGAAHRNFESWDILETYVWPNVVVLGDYMAEVKYMQKFYQDRLHWMDSEINFW
ncbi:MAG: CotH kinase family protein [Bacteroidales bacterium]|nr:CotH kinase family protein [Bacteroidales bacterium]